MRELKRAITVTVIIIVSRTLPRVRELKQEYTYNAGDEETVAPFPGCVN